MDEVRFYNRALTTLQIESIYRSAGPISGAKAAADARPWKAIFDGQTSDFVCLGARKDWPVKDGFLTNRPGSDNAAQTIAEFGDGELRIRFESRSNSILWFNIRQDGPSGYFVDLKPFGELLNQKEHEVVFTLRGPSVTATFDGKPLPVVASGSPLKGILQWNCSSTGSLRIKSMEFRDPK
jgi:hypothetical protein